MGAIKIVTTSSGASSAGHHHHHTAMDATAPLTNSSKKVRSLKKSNKSANTTTKKDTSNSRVAAMQDVARNKPTAFKMQMLKGIISTSLYSRDGKHGMGKASESRTQWEDQVLNLLLNENNNGEGVTSADTNKGIMKKDDEDSSSVSSNTAKRSVRFAPDVRVKKIRHVNDMSEEELNGVYMHPNDFVEIRSQCIELVEDRDFNTEGYFLRGLDKQTDHYREKVDNLRYEIQDAVFLIQELAYQSNIDCTEIIAKVVSKKSEPAVAAAHMSGVSDLFSAFKDTWTQRHIPDVVTPEGEDKEMALIEEAIMRM